MGIYRIVISKNCIAVKFLDQIETRLLQSHMCVSIPENCDINIFAQGAYLIDLISLRNCRKQTVAAFPKERYATREIGAGLFMVTRARAEPSF